MRVQLVRVQRRAHKLQIAVTAWAERAAGVKYGQEPWETALRAGFGLRQTQRGSHAARTDPPRGRPKAQDSAPHPFPLPALPRSPPSRGAVAADAPLPVQAHGPFDLHVSLVVLHKRVVQVLGQEKEGYFISVPK